MRSATRASMPISTASSPTRYAEPGQVLTAGQKVVTLARPEVREAVIAVPDMLAEQLAHANDFTITVALDHVVSMKATGVRAIDPIADPNTRTRNVYLTLNDPPEVFRLGATVSVTFIRPVAAHVDLPATALLEKDGKAFVWVVDPAKSTVSQREVTVGSREGDRVVVTSGVSAGERIVIAGVHSLAAGQVGQGAAMNGFNLSTWALQHRSFVWYLMLLIVVAGGLSYTRLGREEDPAFTIKSMVVYASWPGATVVEMTNQVTDRIERKLQELDTLDYTKSYTTSGQTTIFVNLKDDTPAHRVPEIWVQVRNKVNDIRGDLPSSVQGVNFNDQFGDVFGNIYALHRRRPLVPPAARLCRAGARRDPEDPRRRQGRASRHAGRGHPPRLSTPSRRRTGRRPAGRC